MGEWCAVRAICDEDARARTLAKGRGNECCGRLRHAKGAGCTCAAGR